MGRHPKAPYIRWPRTKIYNHKLYRDVSSDILSLREARNTAAMFRKGAGPYREKHSTKIVRYYNKYEGLYYWVVYARKIGK